MGFSCFVRSGVLESTLRPQIKLYSWRISNAIKPHGHLHLMGHKTTQQSHHSYMGANPLRAFGFVCPVSSTAVSEAC